MNVAGQIPKGFQAIQSSNPFGGMVGPIYEKMDAEGWIRAFRARSDLCNSAGFVHGGMLMTFADIVLARAVMEVAGPPFATVRLVTDFLAPAKQGSWVEGHAIVNKRTRSLAFVEGRIAAGDEKVALISATFRILKPS